MSGLARAFDGLEESEEDARCACGATFRQKLLTFPGAPRALRHPGRCPGCLEAHERSSRRWAEGRSDAEMELDVQRRMRELAPPRAYMGATIDGWRYHGSEPERAAQRKVVGWARLYSGAWPEVQPIYLLRGPYGTGKTHLIWAIARSLVERHGSTGRVLAVADLVRAIRATWGKLAERQEDDVLEFYRGVPFLGLDELSRHAFYGQNIHQHLYDVLNARLVNGFPTILTSNEDDEGLRAVLGGALLSRIEGGGGIIDCEWGDFRKLPAKEA